MLPVQSQSELPASLCFKKQTNKKTKPKINQNKNKKQNPRNRVSELACWVKAVAADQDDLSSIIGPTQRKERIGYELSFDRHTCAKTGALALPQEIKCNKSLKKLSTTKLTEKNSSNPNKNKHIQTEQSFVCGAT